jgi:hypothetical protein
MRSKQFAPPVLDGRPAAGLLALRLAVGAAFVLHGWPKVQNPTGWMTAEGMPAAPGVVQVFAAFGEFLGGFAVIAGALTPVFLRTPARHYGRGDGHRSHTRRQPVCGAARSAIV